MLRSKKSPSVESFRFIVRTDGRGLAAVWFANEYLNMYTKLSKYYIMHHTSALLLLLTVPAAAHDGLSPRL